MTRFLLLLLLTFPLLTACETTSDWFSSDDGDDKKAEKVTVHTTTSCPPVTVPKAVAEQSIGGSAPMDLQAMVNIAVISSKCETKNGAIRQTIDVKLDATKGPALKKTTLEVPFFVAATGPSGDVLAKKMYQTTFDFSGELTDTEELSIVFTLSPVQVESATLYAGLGIDPADLQR